MVNVVRSRFSVIENACYILSHSGRNSRQHFTRCLSLASKGFWFPNGVVSIHHIHFRFGTKKIITTTQSRKCRILNFCRMLFCRTHFPIITIGKNIMPLSFLMNVQFFFFISSFDFRSCNARLVHLWQLNYNTVVNTILINWISI